MSFQKATDLLRLAEMAASRFGGVSLGDIVDTFGVDHRTAQRMTRALEETFPNLSTRLDESRRKFWKLGAQDARLMLAQGLRPAELSALDLAIRRAERDGAVPEVKALQSLRDRLLAAMPPVHARRVETDAETLLEAYGFASRPGPKVTGSGELLSLIAEALRGPHCLSVIYGDRKRILQPHGLLLGTRRYLVAREGSGRMQHFRLDRIGEAALLPDSFRRDPEFDLTRHAARAFGSYQDEAEYGEVIWRFRPDAAATAREFTFHPDQEMTEEPDGSLTLRFHASGHLEMAWHLYQWGDRVEVLAPDALRRLVEDHRRSDFPALP